MSDITPPTTSGSNNNSLIDEIIRLSEFNFERLPMLDIVGERLVENLSVALPELTHVMCEASLIQLDYVPMSQVIDSLPSPALVAVFSGYPFEGESLIAFDSKLLLASMELMLGGNAKSVSRVDAEELTAIEKGFGAQLAATILDEFRRSLSVVADADLEIVRIESDPEAGNIAQQASLCVRMKFSVAMVGCTGLLELVMPYDSLESIRPQLGKIHFGEKTTGDTGWNEQLHSEIGRASVDLEVVYSETSVPIQTVVNWVAGSVLELGVEEENLATVKCEGAPMFLATLGKRSSGISALQIVEPIKSESENENDCSDN